MKKLFVVLLLIAVPAAFAQEKKTGKKTEPKAENKAGGTKLSPGVYAHFQTSLGNFTCELFEKQTPVTVANFTGLAEGTKEYTDARTHRKTKGRYYDGTVFHRIMDGFMIQGGDPLGNGLGDPGYEFKNETSR